MRLHERTPWEYAGHRDHAQHDGPELRPVLVPLGELPPTLKSKRPTLTPARFPAGTSRGFVQLGGP